MRTSRPKPLLPTKKNEPDKPVTAQPVGETFSALAKGNPSQTFNIGGGVYRRMPTCKD